MRIKLIIFLLLILFIGCEKKLIVGPEPPDALIPLTIGNQWVYQYVALDSIPTLNVFYDTVTFDVISTVYNNFYSIEYKGVVDSFPKYNYLRNGAMGLEQLDVNVHPFDTILIFKFPAVLNDSYLLLNSVVSIESTDTMISVSAGEFPSIYYHIVQTDTSGTTVLYEGKIFYSVNVGQVKAEKNYYNSDGSFDHTIEELLIDYTVIIKRDSLVI